MVIVANRPKVYEQMAATVLKIMDGRGKCNKNYTVLVLYRSKRKPS
jgi:hypothetical protein